MHVLIFSVAAVIAASASQATHIIRFLDPEGTERYGQYLGDNKAQLIVGDVFGSRKLSKKTSQVGRLLAPFPMPPAIIGIGLNYWGHIHHANLTEPKTPSIFVKNRYSYNHPFGTVVVPDKSTRPDYEGELGIVIGTRMKDVPLNEALDYVLGYVVCNDVSARCFQSEEIGHSTKGECLGNGGQYTFSKSMDTHAPLGPVLVVKEALAFQNGSGLQIQTSINQELRQNQTTSLMVFGVEEIVSFMSIGTTYDAGTVICSGTPDGVGDTMNPQTYLQSGDIMEVSITGLGVLTNTVDRLARNEEHSGQTVLLDKYLDKHPYILV